ncbi:DUF2861 family protein [Vibrio sp. T187]|uniref:DUF2861 family protein n=1 Tax=Vibrio TaxID=662 RepID=UPI0010C9D782|nr:MULTISPECIES: DUF2861 family protein [Vibrio]MBW3696845.1 DUF2861 family protein [Vibrio sp. T187]
MRALLILLAASTSFSVQALDSSTSSTWFPQTALQATLAALINEQPQQAWQELELALREQPISAQHWQPLKSEILSALDCGQALDIGSDTGLAPFTLSIISRTGLSNSGYQLKLSTERRQLQGVVTLLSPNNKVLLTGKLSEGKAYQEWELSELLSKPESGFYTLKIGDNEWPILVSDYNSKSWLQRKSTTINELKSDLPDLTETCGFPNYSLQWFDSDYQQIGAKQAIASNGNSIHLGTLNPPKNAEFLSASVAIFEYQAKIRVEYIHRVSIPFSPNK